MQELMEVAESVADASMWKLQEAFSAYPIFAGPVMAADVVAAGLLYASQSCKMQFTAEGKVEGVQQVEWGTRVFNFQRWADSFGE